MQRNPSNRHPGNARPSHRQSGEFRGRSSFGAGADSAAGVAQIPAPLPNGQARANGVIGGSQHFDLARSPPNTSNKSNPSLSRLVLSANSKSVTQIPNTFHANSSNKAPVKLVRPAPSFTQPMRQSKQLHANTSQRWVEDRKLSEGMSNANQGEKGNCKFGAKCALAHILPDGRRINRPNGPMGMTMNNGALNLGGRVNPASYQHQDSALANSILSQQQFPADPFQGQYQYSQDDINFAQEYEGGYAAYPGELALNSNPGSKYGSPTNDSQLPISGLERRLTALDAPLPASFDSNGISHIARYGAMAASVPSKFGMESPPASLSQRITGQPLDAVKALRSSAFPSNLRTSSQLGSSPPAVTTEEIISQRKMHSQQNVQRPRLLSASVPRPGVSDDWDDGFPLEEDFLPTNLHDDVLTPQEKTRRLSRPEQEFAGYKSANPGGLGIPSGNSSKVGSPLASSPSRFSALFAKQRQESSNNTGAAAFGHVGSPLRESHIHQASESPFGDGITARPPSSSRSRSGRTGDQSPFFASPSQDSGSNFGMSMISSQLQRTHLTSARNDNSETSTITHTSSRLQPPSTSAIRHVSAPVAGGATGPGRVDRTISSPRISSTRITEEKEGEGDLVFDMDDDSSRRNSSLWGSKSPFISPLGETRNGIGVGSVAGSGGGIMVQKKGGKTFPNGGLENIYSSRS
jgi:hypothetical protein